MILGVGLPFSVCVIYNSIELHVPCVAAGTSSGFEGKIRDNLATKSSIFEHAWIFDIANEPTQVKYNGSSDFSILNGFLFL